MAINTKKISGLQTLTTLTGDEYLMVAYNNRSYKVPTSLLTSDIIESITQTVVTGDEKESPIVIKMANGDVYNFSVRNGKQGKEGNKGKQGDKGETGDTAVALYNTDVADLILDTLNGKSVDGKIIYSADELTKLVLSARQGAYLNEKVEALAEEYPTQDEYDEMLAEGKIDPNTKYFIVSEE